MEYKCKLRLVIISGAFLCLLLTGIAAANGTLKTVYVDGVKLGQSVGPEALSYPYTRLTIGAEGSAWYRYNEFAGKIDEFAVYGVILSGAQISAHYNAANYVNAVKADSPLLYLQFEDANSDNNSIAKNTGSADVNGRYIDSVTLSAGKVGKAAEFSGPMPDANGDCVDVPDEYLYLTLDNVTVEFWIQTTQASEYPRFFQHNNGTQNMGGYGGMYNASTDAIGLIGGGNTNYITVTPGALNDANWHHVVFTFASIKPDPYADEVMADDPCLYLKFDNTLVVDSSEHHWWAGYGQGAMVQKTTGGMGKSIFMDNTLQFNSHADSAAYAYGWYDWAPPGGSDSPPYDTHSHAYAFAPNDISFELWMKRAPGLTPDQFAMLFQQIGSYAREFNAPGLGLYNDANVSKLRVLGGSQWWYTGVNTPVDQNWHQMVVTYKKQKGGDPNSLGIEFYFDGTLANSTTITDPNGHSTNWNPELCSIMIGCENDRGYPYNCFGGYVDEFSIYNGVLSADRVANHYAAWQPRNCAEVWDRGLGMPGDLNKDCVVDLYDYAMFASQWMLCDDPNSSNPHCAPNW